MTTGWSAFRQHAGVSRNNDHSTNRLHASLAEVAQISSVACWQAAVRAKQKSRPVGSLPAPPRSLCVLSLPCPVLCRCELPPVLLLVASAPRVRLRALCASLPDAEGASPSPLDAMLVSAVQEAIAVACSGGIGEIRRAEICVAVGRSQRLCESAGSGDVAAPTPGNDQTAINHSENRRATCTPKEPNNDAVRGPQRSRRIWVMRLTRGSCARGRRRRDGDATHTTHGTNDPCLLCVLQLHPCSAAPEEQ